MRQGRQVHGQIDRLDPFPRCQVADEQLVEGQDLLRFRFRLRGIAHLADTDRHALTLLVLDEPGQAIQVGFQPALRQCRIHQDDEWLNHPFQEGHGKEENLSDRFVLAEGAQGPGGDVGEFPPHAEIDEVIAKDGIPAVFPPQ